MELVRVLGTGDWHGPNFDWAVVEFIFPKHSSRPPIDAGYTCIICIYDKDRNLHAL